jgi:hypothetical protein
MLMTSRRAVENRSNVRSTSKYGSVDFEEKRVSPKGGKLRVDPDEMVRSRTVIGDIRPVLEGRPLAKGRNLVFTDDGSSNQYWIEYDGQGGVQYVVTDAAGVQVDSEIITTNADAEKEGKKCYWCSGSPKTCMEIPCDEIVIVTSSFATPSIAK